jgi:HTH-type transcriptional regulator/antitoxin HigA
MIPKERPGEKMNITLIKTEKDYRKALKRLYELFQVENLTSNSELSDEFDILALLVEDYEKKHYPVEYPNDPVEAILFRVEQMGLSKKDLVKIIGYDSRVSEILSKKRKLTLPMIRKLNQKLNIPLESLVQSY